MHRREAVSLLKRLHEAQGAFYAGEPGASLRTLLTEDVVWIVPGDNSISGVYRGIDAVMRYFGRRRDFADGSFKLHPVDVLVGRGPVAAALTDGTATVAGAQRRWSTVGLYRFRGRLISECRLVPLDPSEFDRIWSARS
jgi:ketosteroid isomerase-like protein